MSRLTELVNEYIELGIKEQIDYEKLYLYSIITHSTAVEGSTVTEVENQLLFDKGISPDKPIEEQFMNLDLKMAYERALEYAAEHSDYSIAMLCGLSALVMKNTGSVYKTVSGNFSSSEGGLRLLNVTAGRGGKSYMAWQKVPARLEDFCNWLNTQRKALDDSDIDGVYRLSFLAHYDLVYIHPWADGNGRMARLVMNMIQYEFGVIPSIVKKESRADYINSLAAAQEKGEEQTFLDYMTDHHCSNLEERIENYQSSLKNDTLKINNDTLNGTINLSDKEKTIIGFIKNNRSISIDEIVVLTGISRRTVTRAIASLKEKGVLSRVGAKKNGSWQILK